MRPLRHLALCTLLLAAAARGETYYGLNPGSQGALTLVGIAPSTAFEVRALPGNALVAQGVVNRLSRLSVALGATGAFKLVTPSPVLALLGADCCNYSGAFFFPVEDGRKLWGTRFVISPMANGASQLLVFSRDAATVTVRDAQGTVVATSPSLAARSRWQLTGLVPGAVYALTATGVVAVQETAGNGNTQVPPVPAADGGQLEDCNSDQGRVFDFGTYGWDRGAFAVFNPGTAAVTFSLRDLASGAAVSGFQNLSVPAGGSFYSGTVAGTGTNAFQLTATGDVTVWAGDTEGGNAVEWMGDDLTSNLGLHGMGFLLSSQTGGATVFAAAAGTVVRTVSGGVTTTTTLGADGTLALAPNQLWSVSATRPVSVQTQGGSGLNDWAVVLRPTTALDTDGNGLDDWQEGGACTSVAPDSDHDGKYDFEDPDDDNDCWPDSAELATRLNPNLPTASYCSGATPVCDRSSGTCRQCLGNADCGGGTVCDLASFTCVQPPRTVITQRPADPSGAATGTFAFFSPSQPTATFACSLDGAAFTACSSPFTTGTLAQGLHTFQARAALGALVDPSPATVSWHIDLGAPAAPVLVVPANGSRSRQARPLVAGSAEPGATVVVAIDGAVAGTAVADGAGAFSVQVTSPLADGTHVASATARDAAGNVSPASAFNLFTVDLTPPAAPLIATPAAGATVGSATPAVAGSAEPGASVAVALDGLPAGSALADAQGLWHLTPGFALVAGPHLATAVATDDVGNVGPASAPTAFTVDLTVLDTAIASGPPALGNLATATFVLAANKPGATFECDLDGAGFAACGSPAVFAGLADGPHALRARALLGAEVDATPAAAAWTVDTAAPTAPAVGSPAAGTRVADATPTLGGQGTPGSAVTVVVDGVVLGTATVNALGQWSFQVPAPLADGLHTLVVSATDAAGNQSPPSLPATFTVDTRAPLPPLLSAPVAGSVVTTASPTYAGLAEPGATVRLEVDGVVVGTVVADASGAFSLPSPAPLADGPHLVRGTATDAVGNLSATSQGVAFTVDATAPQPPVVAAPLAGTAVGTSRPAVSGTAEPGAAVYVTVDGQVVGVAVAGPSGAWSLTLPAALGEGAHTLTAAARDGAGNASSPSAPLAFAVDTVAPAAPVLLEPAAGAVIGLTSPTLRGTAEPGASVTLLLDSVLAGTVRADAAGAFTFPTAPLSQGPHTVTASAQDAAGNRGPASAPTTFTIDTTVLDTSVLTGPPALSASASASFGLSANKPGASFECRLDQGAWAACLNPLVVTGLADGAHALQVRAVTAVQTDQSPASWTWTVDTTPPAAPEVQAPRGPVKTAQVTVTGSAEPGSTVTVLLDTGLAGSAVADASGSFTLLLPTSLADGQHLVAAQARDAAGNSGSASTPLAFTVDTVPPPAPVVSGPRSGDLLATGRPALGGSAEPGSVVSVLLDGTLAGTAPVGPAGTWLFTPATALADGPHAVAATAADAAGNVSPASAAVPFTVDTLAPASPRLAQPTEGAQLSDATPTVAGAAEPGSAVTVYLDGVPQPEVWADATGAFTLTVSGRLTEGPHAATATARDGAGNTSPASLPVHLTVDTLAPAAPDFLSPVEHELVAEATPRLAGLAEPGAAVRVTVDGALVGQVTAGADGTWSLPLGAGQALGEGLHQARARAVDAAGNQGPEAARAFEVRFPGVDAGTPDAGSGGTADGGASGGADGGSGVEDGGVETLHPGGQLSGGGCGCQSGGELAPLLALGLILGRRARKSRY